MVTALVAVPAMASAQTAGDVQSQIQALMTQLRQLQAQLIQLKDGASTTPMMSHEENDASSTRPMMGEGHGMIGGAECPKIGRALGRGDHDQKTGDVSKLQTFLTNQGYFHDPIDGIFGASTQSAVKAFQTATGVAIGGSPSTNGFGQVGPKTRMMIERHCGDGKGMGGGHQGQMGGDGPRPWMGTSTPWMMGHGDCMGTTTGTSMGRPCPKMDGDKMDGNHPGLMIEHNDCTGTTSGMMMGRPCPMMGEGKMDGDHHGKMMDSTAPGTMDGDHHMMPPPPNGGMHQ